MNRRPPGSRRTCTLVPYTELFRSRHVDGMQPYGEQNATKWCLPSDICIPAAAVRLVSREHVARLVANGLEVISSGANVPFADREIFYGPVMEYVDEQLSLIPDFIANCGMARVFAYLMQRNVEMNDDAIFSDVSDVIYRPLSAIRALSPVKTHISSRAYETR